MTILIGVIDRWKIEALFAQSVRFLAIFKINKASSMSTPLPYNSSQLAHFGFGLCVAPSGKRAPFPVPRVL